MTLEGLPDFDQPIVFESGRIFHAFRHGPFVLAPDQIDVAVGNDGRPDLALDIVRGAVPFLPPEPYAAFSLRLVARYAVDEALAALRATRPAATVRRCVLSDWVFRLIPGGAGGDAPQELLSATPLASDGLGSARLMVRLTIEDASVMERLLVSGVAPFTAAAGATITGVAPRLDATVRFNPRALIGALVAAAGDTRVIPWHALVAFFAGDASASPVTVSGEVGAGRAIAYAEAMTDRVTSRFGMFVAAPDGSLEPHVELQAPEAVGDGDFTWELSQPSPARRRTTLSFDPFAAARHLIQEEGAGSIVRRIVTQPVPTGVATVSVFANLPAARIGIAALGATLTAPPDPPARPHPATVTVELTPPEDAGEAQLRLAPGEPVAYDCSTFVVIADAAGVRELNGASAARAGLILRLVPEDFPVHFALIEAMAGLLAIATVEGVCRYRQGNDHRSVPFALDQHQTALALALPDDAAEATLSGEARARDGRGALAFGPSPALDLRLDLSSFPEYGPHSAEITCVPPPGTAVCALDVLAAGRQDTPDEITVLAFTPERTTRTFSWFARSPFTPGLRYRRHESSRPPTPWVEQPSPFAPLVVTFDDLPK